MSGGDMLTREDVRREPLSLLSKGDNFQNYAKGGECWKELSLMSKEFGNEKGISDGWHI